MLRVGLTGGIATGKSTVGRMFAELGCRVLESDEIAHRLYDPDKPVYDTLVREFGRRIVNPDRTINRQALGAIVFADPALRRKLNSIVHPPLIQKQKDWLDDLQRREPHAIAIVEAALMIEAGTYKDYDKIVVVACSPEEQKRRLLERGGLSEDQIETRIASQMPVEEKIKYADYVIEASGNLDWTRKQVLEVNSKLRELASYSSGTSRSGPPS